MLGFDLSADSLATARNPDTRHHTSMLCIPYSGAPVQQLLLQVRGCYPATVLYQLQPSGGIKWPLW